MSPTGIKITNAAPQDAPAIAKLNDEFNYERDRDWGGLIASSATLDSEMFVIKADEGVVGFLGLIYNHWNKSTSVTFYVHPDYRRRNLGAKLLDTAIRQSRQKDMRCLMVEEPEGCPNLDFYKNQGFKECGHNDELYLDRRRAIWLSLALRSELEWTTRAATLDDLPKIQQLNKAHYHSDRDWKGIILSSAASSLCGAPSTTLESELRVLECEDEIISFGGVIYHEWNHTAEITNVFTHPDHRRMNFGSNLVKHMVAAAKNKPGYRCIVGGALDRTPAVKLYEKLGFRKCGYNDRLFTNTGKDIVHWFSFDLQ